jgi:16S rRNA (cytosine1402-N4)-methyltransferase
MNNQSQHIPVLLKETIQILSPHRGDVFIDATVGAGGHAIEIIKKIMPTGRLIAIDFDPKSIKIAKQNLKLYQRNIDFVQGNFASLPQILKQRKIKKVNGILLDLGFASHQMAEVSRGLSFTKNSPLDMRLDPNQELTAVEILNSWSEKDLAELFQNIGEEKFAKNIARGIIRVRATKPINTTKQLVEIVKQSTPPAWRFKQKTHFATNIFRALRMAVNNELPNLEKALPAAIKLLQKNGRLTVITFHSLEANMTKKIFQKYANPCTCPPKSPICICGQMPVIKIINKKSIKPSAQELKLNPKARSAQLRAVEKIV